MSKMVKIIAFIGNICSGKTTAANILKKEGFKFFPVEKMKLIMGKKYGDSQKKLYDEYFREIVSLSKEGKLVIESTGGSRAWPVFYKKLKKKFGDEVLTIKVDSDYDLCLIRFRKNKEEHRKNARRETLEIVDKRLKSGEVDYDLLVKNSKDRKSFEKSIKEISKNLNENGKAS
jgi:dephospho-CoA kinase